MITDHYCIFSALLTIDGVSLLQGMFTKLLDNLRVQSVSDVEHELTVTLSSFWITIWKILCHAIQYNELIVKVLYAQFIIFDDSYKSNICSFHQLLISCHHSLNEFFGEHLICGYIILQNISLESWNNLLADDFSDDHRSHLCLSCPEMPLQWT